jgi:peptide/nickel transport system substrate-binding protein
MKLRTGLSALTSIGLAVALAAPLGAGAVTRTTKKKATATTKATTAPATTAAVAQATPKAGGKIVFGLEAESSEGWLQPSSQWAISGQQVAYSVFDRMMSVNDKGQIVPSLLESATPTSDYKTWTLKVRPGIKFHNGEDLNADAVAQNLRALACGSVTTSILFPLNGFGRLCPTVPGVVSDGNMTVSVTLISAWVSFPAYLSSFTVAAPAQIKSGDRNKPIGTGPFVFKEWQVGVKFVATKNPNYWRPGLPVADEIEFRPIVDESARLAQLQSGQIDMTHTANFLTHRELDDLAKGGKIKLYKSEQFGEVSYDMLNAAVPPFNNRDCRLAAAYAKDVDTVIKLRAPGASSADGPFPKGALGYLPDSGFPKFNLDKAKEFYAKCKAAVGGGKDVEFTLGTTNVPDNIETAQILKQMHERAGFKVNLVNIEQQRYIGVALVGAFQYFTWRNHGGVDPDGQRIWWHSEMSGPGPDGKPLIDGKNIAINFGRIQDATIDRSLDLIRTNSDPAVRKKAAEDINGIFADQAYNLWTLRTRWALATGPKVTGFENQRTAGGEKIPELPAGHVGGIAFFGKS